MAMYVMSTLAVMTATEAVRFSNSAILLIIYLLTTALVPIKVFLRGSTLYCDRFPQSLKESDLYVDENRSQPFTKFLFYYSKYTTDVTLPELLEREQRLTRYTVQIRNESGEWKEGV